MCSLFCFISGCWEEDVLSSIVTFLIDGNRDIRADLLHAMSRGKNVQYVDKVSVRIYLRTFWQLILA